MSEHSEVHRRRAARLLATVVVVAIVTGAVLGAFASRPLTGALVGLVVGGATIGTAHLVGLRVALAVGRAREVSATEQPRLHNLVNGLCATAGVTPPRVCVVDDEAPNAFVAGRSRSDAALVVTTGLVSRLDRIQMEAVVAQLLIRLRNHDAVVSTLAMSLVGWPVLVGELLLRRRWWNGGRVQRPGDPPAASSAVAGLGSIVLVVAPLIASIMRRVVPPDRVTHADVGACGLTRYPPGLAGALDVLQGDATVTHSATAATAHLWFAQPMSGVGDAGRLASVHRRFDTHPPLEERIALVREL